MPCTYDDSFERSEAAKEHQKVVSLLCKASDLLIKNGIAMPEDLALWAACHSIADSQRKSREQAEKIAHAVYLKKCRDEIDAEIAELEQT